ncbi:c-type heme family protein [Caldimonas thermodepolymerans]|uniref:c-type heme family protein n=1 Tax=Caldimonas thermodepolymerans TaxID=215580 RepID=UPI0024925331|nr:DUF3365 domain-containing protein [Caldimonas thermodepolymerans]
MTLPSRFLLLRLAACIALLPAMAPPEAARAASGQPVQAPAPPLPPLAAPAPAPSPDPALERAQAAAAAFHGRLRTRLQAALRDGGPVAAIAICHDEAPRIAATVMAGYGVRLGRVALPGLNRNPAQAATGWQLDTLRDFQQAVDGGGTAAAQQAVLRNRLPAGVLLRTMRGIATEPACLACHGRELAAPVREAIRARYPGDGATGFDVGDLRGALWVEAPADSFPTGATR